MPIIVILVTKKKTILKGITAGFLLPLFSERLPSTNLIDLNSELPVINNHYVNDVIFNPRPAPRDVFDMRKFMY